MLLVGEPCMPPFLALHCVIQCLVVHFNAISCLALCDVLPSPPPSRLAVGLQDGCFEPSLSHLQAMT